MLHRSPFKNFTRCSSALLMVTLGAVSGKAQAADSRPFDLSAAPSGNGGGSKGGYRAFMLALPVVNVGGGTVGRAELNLYGRGSLAIEGTYQDKGEDITKKEQKLTGESMITQARAITVFLARYSEPMQMAGFYYGLGVGYRHESANWHLKPTGAPATAALDEVDFANHSASFVGPTGHLRGGWRYVGKEFPLLIGAYVGMRHFESIVSDAQPSGQAVGGGAYTNMTESEKDHLKRRFATTPEAGLEIGFAL